jgi:exoribonuclease-2
MRPSSFNSTASGSTNSDSIRISIGSVIEYEQHSKLYLGVVTGERKNLFVITNERGQELTLPAERIFLLPLRVDAVKSEQIILALEEVLRDTQAALNEVDIESVWELVKDTHKEVSEKNIVELLFPKPSGAQLLAVRRALVGDSIFFKRRKSGFEPRDAEIVEELRVKARQDALRKKERDDFAEQLLIRLNGNPGPFEKNWSGFGITELEQFAALGASAVNGKETNEFIEEFYSTAKLEYQGRAQEKAIKLLIKIGHWSEEIDLNLYASGRPIEFSPTVMKEIEAITSSYTVRAPSNDGLTIVTIDSESTKDIDDGLSFEKLSDGYKIGIHISDVSSIVMPGSKLNEQAVRRATSVYTPDYQIPMLPPELSEQLLSLVAGEVRSVMSFYIETDSLFDARKTYVKKENLKISQRLSYSQVDSILADEKDNNALASMLLSLWDAASHFESRRIMDGALQFNRREKFPKVDADGKVYLERSDEETPARKLVSELMVAANIVAATYARDYQIPLVFRGQDKPDVEILRAGEDIIEGPAREYFRRGLMKRSVISTSPLPHYGLAAPAYVQITSPIRRFLDLVNQRQLSNQLTGEGQLLNSLELRELLELCESRLDEANSIQRQRSRYWFLRYFEQQRISEVTGVIIRADEQRPLVELDDFQTILPFQQSKKVGEFANRETSRLGTRIKLKVQKLSARDDKLLLVEGD